MSKSSDIAVDDDMTTAVATVMDNEFSEFADFESLIEGADKTASRDVYSSADDKDELCGTPFVVTGITFRPSDKNDGDYVSLEATTKDNERIVINDGSTGIRRQVVQYLTFKGIIAVPDTDDADLKSKYDQHNENFEVLHGAERIFADDGSSTLGVMVPVRLLAKKGLRRSDYDGPQGKATTFYLA